MYPSLHCSIDVIQDEARQLVRKGVITRTQPIYVLCQHFPSREWPSVERELEQSDFLLSDKIADLMGYEEWEND